MQTNFDAIRHELDELAKQIAGGTIPATEQEWGGADVIVTSQAQPPRRAGGFYPEPRRVLTPHAKALSWLFYQLRDTFAELIDGCSKIEFYGRLACAAQHYQQQVDQEVRTELLQSVLHEAYQMLEEMKHGRFTHLTVAAGNAIHKGQADGEEAGYATLEEVKSFFA